MTQYNNKGITILVVDDEPNNLEILKLDLEDEGYNILTGTDGVEGLKELQDHKDDVQVILLDRMMPNMNGIEFMKNLRADKSISSIPVIMQTAASDKEQIAEGMASGVYYYLTKPYDKTVLLSILKSAIQSYKPSGIWVRKLEAS
jgi:two-component system, cell cycle response regulator